MSAPNCLGCRERDERPGALEARVRELEARLGKNASNWLLPPSANPPQAPPPVAKTPTGKKRGAQLGHPPLPRRRLPPQRLQQVISFVPATAGRPRCPAEAGCRFVERMLTVVQTLRLQRRSVLAYLEQAPRAHRNGLPAPILLPTG